MNKDTLQGDWKIMKGKVKEKWGKLTDDDITEINGKKEQLIGKLQKKYGYAKDMAEDKINEWESSCSSCKDENMHKSAWQDKHPK